MTQKDFGKDEIIFIGCNNLATKVLRSPLTGQIVAFFDLIPTRAFVTFVNKIIERKDLLSQLKTSLF